MVIYFIAIACNGLPNLSGFSFFGSTFGVVASGSSLMALEFAAAVGTGMPVLDFVSV